MRCGTPPLKVLKKLFAAATDEAIAEPTSSWRESLAVVLKDQMVRTLGAAYFLLKPARYAILLWGPVIVAEQPLTCVARGCGMALERMDKLGSIFASD